MPTISKSIMTQAHIERVFAILSDPGQISQLNPDLVILSFTPSPNGGFDNSWEYKMGGLKFKGETKMAELARPYLMVYETTGSIPSRWIWQLQQNGNSTQVSVNLDYTLPGLFGVIKKVVAGQNEKALETQLSNLKRLSEGMVSLNVQ